MEKLRLKNPLTVDGVKLTEIAYDFDLLTMRDLLNADKAASMVDAKTGMSGITIMEMNTAVHVELFVAAACKASPNLTREDLQRMSARDAVVAAQLGRDFFLDTAAVEDGPPEE